MDRAGFGPPAAVVLSEPWGHVAEPNDPAVPIDPSGPGADNPPGLGPAGTVHASISDLARYAGVWADEGAPLISSESFEAITTEVSDGFALGWVVASNDGAQELVHDGSNTMFYSTVRISPARDRGLVVVANSGAAQPLVNDLADHILSRYR